MTKKLNNYQNIRQMSIEKMTEFIYRYASYLDSCCRCPIFGYCDNYKRQSTKYVSYKEIIQIWLKTPYKDGGYKNE